MGNSNSSSAADERSSRLSAGRSSTELHLKTTVKMMNITTTRSQEQENTSNKTTRKCNSNQTQSSSYDGVKPKHLLWGCSTIEEHYEIVRHACCGGDDQLRGLKGLKRIGFEFRKVHSSYPCSCQQQQQQQSKEIIMDEEVESLSNDDNRNNDVDGVVDDDGGSSIDDDDDDDEKLEEMRNIFNIKMGGSLSSNDYNNDSYRFSDRSTTDFRFSERSAATMFSLATHHSISSCEESSSYLSPRSSIININAYNNSNDDNRNAEGASPCSPSNGCSLRLYHIPSNTMITEKNHQHFIAHGTMYDEVSKLCMEYAQDIMIETGNLEWVTVCPKRNIRALVSKRTCINNDNNDDDGDDIENIDNSNNSTTKSTTTNNNDDNNKRRRRRRRPTLVIITGTGKVGAGIFSRRLSMTQGIEPATAVPFVEEAIRRDMDLIILDPNNSDSQNAMEAVEVSLDKLCFQNISKSIEKDDDDISDDDDDDHGMHILAHSMAGSQLVRFLLNKANHHEIPSLSEEDRRIDQPEILHLEGYLKQIKSVAFTDSNHNINWIKKYPHLSHFFTGQQSIYFKSHKIYDDYKPVGQIHHDCQYWKHRFGTIKTLWAGTNEHALTNHTARHHIWDHFDSFR